jgi:hypothetical protein
MRAMKSRQVVVFLLVAAPFLAAPVPLLAKQANANHATSLLVLMRVDDQLAAQVKAAMKLRCAAMPPMHRDECRTLSAALLQDINDDKQLSRAMTPYFERTYTDDEIKQLTDFFESSDGKLFTDGAVDVSYYRIYPDWQKPPRPIDADTQNRVNNFFQSGTGKKFYELAQEYKREFDKQSLLYVCANLERRGSSCASLGIVAAAGKSSSTKIVTIFQERQIAVVVPDGWLVKESLDGENGVRSLTIRDANEEIELFVGFLPDIESRLSSRRELEREMHKLYDHQLANSVERELMLQFANTVDGEAVYATLTERSLVGRDTSPPDRLYRTVGIRSWKNAFVIFILDSNRLETATHISALEGVLKGIREVRGSTP